MLYADEQPAETPGTKASLIGFKTLQASGLPKDLGAPDAPYFLKGRDHVLVVVSTGSGSKHASNVWQTLIQPLFAYYGWNQGVHYDLHLTESENTVSELTHQLILPRANKGRRQTIVLLSGDGGVVDMINALIAGSRTKEYRKPEIALLPLGSGNALANSYLGLKANNEYCIRSLLAGKPREIPIFRATFSSGARLLVNEGRDERELEGNSEDGSPVAHGAVVCSWGLHATLVADSDTTEYRSKFGAERFVKAATESLYPSDGSPPHAYKGKVSVLVPGNVGWQALDQGEHGYILATFVSQLEAGFTISPASEPLDGKLQLVHFGPLSGDEAMGIMTEAQKGGSHTANENVGYEEIEGLRIEFAEEDARWRRVCVDGKIIRVEKGGFVEVRPKAEGVVDLLVRET